VPHLAEQAHVAPVTPQTLGPERARRARWELRFSDVSLSRRATLTLVTMSPWEQPREGRLERDGRIVGWSEAGDPDGRPERPGFGISTPLPERGFADVADDLAALLDQLRVESAPVYGFSGGGPFVLGFAARHPERVKAPRSPRAWHRSPRPIWAR
jgi:hypothetical protein